MSLAHLNRHALGVFPTRSEAEHAIRELQAARFPMEQVSIIARDDRGKGHIAGVDIDSPSDNQAARAAKTGAVTGGIGGVILGALEALGITTWAAFLLPGAGQVLAFGTVAANVLATAIAGGAIGAAAGGLIGGLVGWGVPEERAKVYQDLVSKGEYLVMVEGTEEQARLAESVLHGRGIREWEVYQAPQPVINP